MKNFKQFLAEDIINVLDNIEDNLRSGDIGNIPQAHISTIANLRVYVYSNNEDDKATVGINTIVGDQISDSDAIATLAKFASGTSEKTRRLSRNEVNAVMNIIRDGKRDNYKDFLDVVSMLKNKLRKM